MSKRKINDQQILKPEGATKTAHSTCESQLLQSHQEKFEILFGNLASWTIETIWKKSTPIIRTRVPLIQLNPDKGKMPNGLRLVRDGCGTVVGPLLPAATRTDTDIPGFFNFFVFIYFKPGIPTSDHTHTPTAPDSRVRLSQDDLHHQNFRVTQSQSAIRSTVWKGSLTHDFGSCRPGARVEWEKSVAQLG